MQTGYVTQVVFLPCNMPITALHTYLPSYNAKALHKSSTSSLVRSCTSLTGWLSGWLHH